MPATHRILKLLVLAAGAAAIGSHGESRAAIHAAAKQAALAGVDLWALCDTDERFLHLDLTCTVPWTEEPVGSVSGFVALAPVRCADDSVIAIYAADEGVMLEHYASAPDYRLLNRGFWRDCEPQEAVWFAREAWGC